MKKKQNMPRLSELNLTNRFLFDEVMEDAQTHQDVLSIIFGRDITLLHGHETEKELRTLPSRRSIRMDVFAVDEEQSVYNTEMQSQKKMDLSRRSRYYQSMIDTSLLKPGVPDYSALNTVYIIMIMPFDLFGYGKYCYTFEEVCKEMPECVLGDGAYRIFLNTRGTNDSEVSRELIDFLHYVESTTDDTAAKSDSSRVRRIHERVRTVRSSEETGVKYMQAWEEKYFDRQEGREEGLAEGLITGEKNKLKELVSKKLEKGKSAEEISNLLEENLALVQELISELQAEQA